MAAIIVMSNGDAYHTTTAKADEVLRLTTNPDAAVMTARSIVTGKQIGRAHV